MEDLDEPDDALLSEQVEYYRARAEEYDRWFFREGRYDRGDAATRTWFAELEAPRQALSELALDGAEVLELAGGTGLWTERLVDRAASLTVIDASSEVLEINRKRLGARAAKVRYVVADLFEVAVDRRFDSVVFCFWISHVPHQRLADFLGWTRRLLRPGGSLFFVDSRREPASTASDHVLPERGAQVMVRRLDDGRQFRMVKNFWHPDVLAEAFAAAGLEVAVRETPTYFVYGTGSASHSRADFGAAAP